MIESIVDALAGMLMPAFFLFVFVGVVWDTVKYKKRFPNAPLFHWRKIKPSSQQQVYSRGPQSINTDSAGFLARESMFKDQDSYRLPQDTAFDRPYTFDQPAYMEHNINGVPMMGGVDLHGNPFGTDH